MGKVMSLLFNMLSRFSSKEQVSFNLMAALNDFGVILEPRKIKSNTVSTFSPSISHEVMGPDAHDLCVLNVEL